MSKFDVSQQARGDKARNMPTYLAVERRVCDGSHCASQAEASGSTAPGKAAQDLTRSQHGGGATLCLREAFFSFFLSNDDND